MKKLFTFILAAVMLTGVFSLAAAGEDSPFTDVKTSRWSYGAVLYAYKNGYMNGVGDGRFDPAGTMTRGMVVTVLWRRDGSPAVEFTNDFDDVKEGKYYSAAVIWAKNNGIVNGVSEGIFDPGGKITREQLAAMLNRYTEYHGLDFRPCGQLDSFPDASAAHNYAKDALSWATGKGLITGVKAGNEDLLDPRGNATREQFATILKRFDDTDLTLPLEYNQPVLMSRYTEKDYPLVTDADFYVATDGNDSAAGTLEAPFASFARAAEAARELKKTRAAGDVTVAFRAGDYGPMDYCFTAEDSGDENGRIIYCAYGDGKVQFTGGPVVALDEFVPLDDADKAHFSAGAAEHIKKADLSEKRCADMLSYSSETFTYEYGRLDAARYPNRNASGDEIYLENLAEGIAFGQTRIKPMINRLKKYHTLEGVEMIGCIGHEYWKTVFPVTGFDPETGIITYNIIGPQYGLSEFAESVFFINIMEELDHENESYVDPETKTLYVYEPHEDEYIVSAAETFCTFEDANYISFIGFDFIGCTGDGIVVHGNSITFDRCTIYGIGGRAGVRVYGTDFRMQDCDFAYTAGCGMWFDSNKDVNDLVPTGPYIDNCLIHDVGQKWRNLENPGIRLKRAVGAKVSHCEIYNTPCSAISYGYCAEAGPALERTIDCVFEYNYIYNATYDLGDVGAIYTGRSFVNRDNIFRFNLVQVPHGVFSIYLDDGVAAQQIYGNIFYDIPGTGVLHSGGQYMQIHDNAFIDAKMGWDGDKKTSFSAWAKYYTWYDGQGGTAWESGNFRILYGTLKLRPMPGDEYYELWHSRWPELYEVIEDYDDVENPNCPATPGFCSVYNNYSIGSCRGSVDEGVEKFAIRCENNRDFEIDENPLFVNPTLGDYRIRDDVSEDEFMHIPFELIGRY